MSIGNLKTEGNKGNNFPYQAKVLKGLQCVCDQLKELNVDTTAIEQTLLDIEAAIGDLATETTLLNVDNNIANIVGNTDGVLRSPNILRTSSLGNLSSVATEIYSVSVANIGVANGVVQGAALKPGEVLNFDASSLNHYFNSFAYDATGTEFIIIYIS